jgi:hypothetical protein
VATSTITGNHFVIIRQATNKVQTLFSFFGQFIAATTSPPRSPKRQHHRPVPAHSLEGTALARFGDDALHVGDLSLLPRDERQVRSVLLLELPQLLEDLSVVVLERRQRRTAQLGLRLQTLQLLLKHSEIKSL